MWQRMTQNSDLERIIVWRNCFETLLLIFNREVVKKQKVRKGSLGGKIFVVLTSS